MKTKRYTSFSKQVNRYSELPSGITGFTPDGFKIWQEVVFTGGNVQGGTGLPAVRRIQATESGGTWSLEEIWFRSLTFMDSVSSAKSSHIGYDDNTGRLYGVSWDSNSVWLFELNADTGAIVSYEKTNISGQTNYGKGEMDSSGRFWTAIRGTLYRFNDMSDSTDRDTWTVGTGSGYVKLKWGVSPSGNVLVGNSFNWKLVDKDGNLISEDSYSNVTNGYGQATTLSLTDEHFYISTAGGNHKCVKVAYDKTTVFDPVFGEGYRNIWEYLDEFITVYRTSGTTGRFAKLNIDTGLEIDSVNLGSNLSVGYKAASAVALFTNNTFFMFSCLERVSGLNLVDVENMVFLTNSVSNQTTGGGYYSVAAIGGTNLFVLN